MMKSFTFLIFSLCFFLFSLPSFSQSCGCDYTVPFNTQVDGNVLNIQPGDVICLSSSITYGSILFENLHGTEANPITIKNCGGIARVNSIGSFGIKFQNSEHVKFLGNGDINNKYGIKITTRLGFYLTFEEYTTNFEAAFIEIAGGSPTNLNIPEAGFAGIGCKTKPHCDGSSNRGVWTMYNPIIHDNYVHDTGGEGMYIGHGFYKGRIEATCLDSTYSHSIVGLRVYNNRIENTGYDGLQIKNADSDCEVYNNVIKNYGVNDEDPHNEGLFLGEGVTGKIHHNWVEKGTGNGMQLQGIGNLDVYNNVFINSGGYGFYGAHGAYVVRLPNGYYNIFNNTIINSTLDGFVFFNDEGGVKRLYNNIIAKAGLDLIRKGATVDEQNNYVTNNLADVKFANVAASDLQLLAGSPAINAGKNLTTFGMVDDYNNLPRPFGANYDIGAFEFGAIVNPPPVVSITSPANNAIFVAGNTVIINATASDPNGSINRVEFYIGTTKIGEDLTSPYSFTLPSTSLPGVYNLIAKAIDNESASANSTPVNITLTNVAPTVSLTNPLNSAIFSAGTNIVMDVTASDTDGSIFKVEFYAGTTKIGEDLTGPYTITWNNVLTGTYNLTAKATDNVGGITTSAIIAISVINTPPTISITSPANNANFVSFSDVNINANALDADGSIIKVEFFQGTTKIGEDVIGPSYSITWNNVPSGTYSITAKATDNGGAIKTSQPVIVIVNNIAPVVSITSPANNATFAAGSNVTINSSASDADGIITKVEFFYGSNKIGEDLSSPYSILWSNIPEGTFSLTAKATDNSAGVTTSSPVSIKSTNAAPVVSITSPIQNATFTPGSSITINSNATDSDGTIFKVEFFFGTTKIGEDLSSPYTIQWNSVPEGTFSLTAKATDNNNSVTTSTPVSILIKNFLPTVSISSPVNNASFTAGSNITINSNAADADGSILKVEFFFGTTKIGEDLSSPYSIVWPNVPQGTHSLTAKATDNLNGSSTSTPITITVTNIPPVTSISSPANNSVFSVFSSIIINANASDADGSITKVEFFHGTVKIGEDLISPYSITWTNVPQGTYSLSVKATDNVGTITTSSPVNIVVSNAAPIVNITAPADNTTFPAGSDITLNAISSDPDGSVVKVEFYNGSTKIGEDLNSPYSFTWINVPEGTYSITASAIDNGGATAVSSPITVIVNVTLNIPPVISLTSPTEGAIFSIGQNVSINANATDSDGTITKVEFYEGNVLLNVDVTAPYSYIWINPSEGTHSLTGKVFDDANEITTSNPVNIIIKNFPPQTSITSPANDSDISAGTTITITAIASDQDGTISKIEFFQGSTKIGEDLTSPYTLLWSSSIVGSYNFSVVATDNNGATTSSLPIKINITNILPVVTVTQPVNNQVFVTGSDIIIAADASDSDGIISKVEFFLGTVKLGEDLNPPYQFVWLSAIEGEYNITASATDNVGGTNTSSPVKIIVRNAQPVVSIIQPVNDASFVAGNDISILADAIDSDGTIVKVEFFQGNIKIGEVLNAPYNFVLQNVVLGTYSFTAAATDNNGAVTTSLPVSVIVMSKPPIIAITSPANNSTSGAGLSIAINADASDPDGTIAKVEFFQGTTKLGEDASAPYLFTWDNVALGEYSFTAVATDNTGASTTSAPISVEVINSAPTVSITQPVADTVYTAGSNVIINANAFDSDGSIVKVEFFEGNIKLGESITAPYTFNFNNLVPGTYSFTAIATDNTGASTTSVPINISVINYPPAIFISSPSANSKFVAGNDIIINAEATDQDGIITKVEFFADLLKIGEDLSSPYSFTWTNATAGSFVLTAKVTDDQGSAVTSAGIAIVVEIFNEFPTIRIDLPSSNAIFTSCTPINIKATAQDLDGTISKVIFYIDDELLTESASSPLNYSFNNLSEGQYMLTAVAQDNRNAKTTSNAIRIEVTPPVVTRFSGTNSKQTVFSPSTLISNIYDTIYFENTSDTSLSKILSAQWDFKDNSTSTEYNTSHIFKTTGIYKVALTVVNLDGCSETVEMNVLIKDTIIPDIYLPNAFAPNEKEMENRTFKSYGRIAKESYNLKIFSRWGKLIYETEDNQSGWDGGIEPMGTYAYVVEGKYFNGVYFRKGGTITLIR